jgi:3-deoxy-D-manno-octulosonate 8-phosphate phosphatase (KDO 8-P phosphatase)
MAREQQMSAENEHPLVGLDSVTTLIPSDLAPLPPVELELLHLFDKMRAVRALVFDVDGVFTDNTILVTEQNELLRTMNVRDGQAIKWALQAGFQVGIITGGRSEGTKKRFTDLGIQEYYSGVAEKLPCLTAFLERTGAKPSELCYMGDDLPDLPVLRKAVLACCPADAVPEVLEVCDYVSPLKGGQGCVRDLLERVLKIQGKWPKY